jgi:hypothetical protein
MLYNVFSLFVGDDSFRPVMHSPFEINGKVYATDSFTLIRCDKSYCDFEIANPHRPPDAEAVIPVPNTNQVLNIDKSVFEQYKTEDEYENTGEDVACKVCDGYGLVEWTFEHYYEEDDCPACDGSGFEEEEKAVKTGRKTFGMFRVKLNESYFRMDLFYKLVKAQDILGGDITLIHQSKPTSAVLFKVGFCEILLMPCLLHDIDDTDGILSII